jgi:hypothetical protein
MEAFKGMIYQQVIPSLHVIPWMIHLILCAMWWKMYHHVLCFLYVYPSYPKEIVIQDGGILTILP